MLKGHIKPAEKSWMYDRTDTIGASEIMRCARYLWAVKNEVEGEPQGWGFMERGNIIEAWAVDRLLAAGVPIEKAGDDQETLLDGFLSGTPDGFVGDCVVEFKSRDPRARREPKRNHIIQTQINIELAGKARGMLVYINASDLSDIEEIPVERDPDVIPMAKERARTVYRAQSMDELPREGWIAADGECDLCPFRSQCVKDAPEGVGVPDEVESELAALRDEAKQAADDEKRAKSKVRAAKERISEILRKHGARRAPGFARITVSRRSSLDQKAMIADGIDLIKYQISGASSETVTLES